MPGPLPAKIRRRTNKPSIPTTSLPSRGRKGRPPRSPYELGELAQVWWRWAWRTPQACAWSTGDLYVVARRALLEDLLVEDAGGAPAREARQLDDRLGLTPKGLAQLRWVIVDETLAEQAAAEAEAEAAKAKAAGVAQLDEARDTRRDRLGAG